MQRYSQVRAMFAITKASLRGLFRNYSAVIFGFIFPFVFIVVFGFIGNSGLAPVYKVVIAKDCDTSNALYESIKQSDRIRLVTYAGEAELKQAVVRGKIAAVLSIQKTGNEFPAYTYSIKSSNASSDKWPQLLPVLEAMANTISDQKYQNRPTFATADFNPERDIETVRKYKTIDFILPGQLGFSLLSSGVFGVAFMFFNLRSTLVLKRLFASPIKRAFIVLGEALSRVIFQMLTAIVIIVAGKYLFGFTLVNGWQTLFEMLFLSFIGLLVFMGMGFVISGLAKSESTIPPIANLITLPQFLLAGTFFSVEVFPSWLQPVSNILPLTHLNTAMRNVAFEGQNLWDVRFEIGILLLWGVIVYVAAVKVFKWE